MNHQRAAREIQRQKALKCNLGKPHQKSHLGIRGRLRLTSHHTPQTCLSSPYWVMATLVRIWVQEAETTSETTRTLEINFKNPYNIHHTFLGTKLTRLSRNISCFVFFCSETKILKNALGQSAKLCWETKWGIDMTRDKEIWLKETTKTRNQKNLRKR